MDSLHSLSSQPWSLQEMVVCKARPCLSQAGSPHEHWWLLFWDLVGDSDVILGFKKYKVGIFVLGYVIMWS